MKKPARLFLPVFFSLFMSSAAWAQVSVGLKTGVNLSNFSYDEVDPYDSGFSGDSPGFSTRAGLNFAVLFNYAFTPTMSIQVEPGFSQRGAKTDNTVEAVQGGQRYRIEAEGKIIANYVELPILFQYKPQFGKLEGILSFGPELRYLTSPLKFKSTAKTYVNGEFVSEEKDNQSLSGDDGIRKFDIGLVGGVGVAYPLGALKIFGEARYHFGINNLVGHFDGNESKLYNRGASINVGILLPVGKNE